jgi:hypothetical protein
VEGLEPKLLEGLAVSFRTEPDLLLRLLRLPVLLRLQRNRVEMSYAGIEFDIAMGFCTDAVVRDTGMTEPGTGTKPDMDIGLGIGFDTDIGMLQLLW